MRLTSSLKRANPVERSSELSARGRAELRNLVGADEVPVVDRVVGQPGRPIRWLVPSLAAVVVVAGLGLAMSLSGRATIVPYAFADTVTAMVMPGEVTPIPVGTSLIFDVPYPAVPGQPVTHVVDRVWIAVNDQIPSHWGWTDIPDNLTFSLTGTSDGIGYYRADNWPFDKNYEVLIVGPDSGICAGTADTYWPFALVDQTQTMAVTTFYLCGELPDGKVITPEASSSQPSDGSSDPGPSDQPSSYSGLSYDQVSLRQDLWAPAQTVTVVVGPAVCSADGISFTHTSGDETSGTVTWTVNSGGEAPVGPSQPPTATVETSEPATDVPTDGTSWPTDATSASPGFVVYTTPDSALAGPSTTTVEVAGLTQDPDTMIALLKQFELGQDGYWADLPAGYDSWRAQRAVAPGWWLSVSCADSTDSPVGDGQLAPGAYVFPVADYPGDSIVVAVDQAGQCTVTSDMAPGYLSEAGVTLNDDGTCSYQP